MELPSVEGPDDVEVLAAALREIPLEPQKSATKEVRAWAKTNGVGGDDAAILEAYNEAAGTQPGEAREGLERAASQLGGRSAVIALLGFAGASDGVRLLAIEALEGKLERADAAALARVNVKQRDQVIGAGVRLLASIESGEALFALEKVFGKREDTTGEAARRYASRLHTSVPESAFVADVAQGRDSQGDVSRLEPREVLFAALALPARRQVRLARAGAGKALLALVEPEILSLEAGLRKRGKDSSLPPYLARVREELLEFILLTGSPEHPELQKRAAEALFRRDDLAEVEELAPHLPRLALESYATRALSRENRRRGRPERAVAALSFVREREDEARNSLRSLALECLTEDDAQLRLAAARLLAVDEEELGAEVRAAMLKCLESLPPRQQSVLAREMKGRGGGPQGHDAFVRWVEAARGPEVAHRLGGLLERWASDNRLEPEQAGELIEAFGSCFSRLEEPERAPLEADLVAVVADWIKSRRGQIVGSVGPLMRWQRFRVITIESFPDFADRLLADQARGLLAEAIGVRSGLPEAALIERAAAIQLPDDGLERLVLPVLEDAVAVDLEAFAKAFADAAQPGQRTLLAAGLLALSGTRAQTVELQRTLVSKTTAGLSAKSEMVLAAVADAQEAAVGNERLVAVLDEVNRAISAHTADPDATEANGSGGAPAPSSGEEAPAEVIGWREKALMQYPVLFPDEANPRQELMPSGDLYANPEDLAKLIAELDKRAHSTRLAPPAERPFYLRDLTSVLGVAIDADIFVAGSGDDAGALGVAEDLGDAGRDLVDLVTSGRTEIRKLFWAQWSDRRRAAEPDSDGSEGANVTTDADLLAALTTAARSPDDPSVLSMLESSAEGLSRTAAAPAIGRLEAEHLPSVWGALATLLELQLLKLSELSERSRNKEKAIGAEVGDALDLPFRVIDQLFFSYFRLRVQLRDAGWSQVEERLGQVKKAGQLDPDRHDVRGGIAERYVIRTLGIQYKGNVISRAVVEPLDDADSSEGDAEAPIDA